MKKHVKILYVEFRNVLSYGNNWTRVNLDRPGTNLIIGENRDIDDDGSRNGVGKSSAFQAISLALFNRPTKKIKVGNLTNRVNKKGLEIKIGFVTEWNSTEYQVHWGLKPDFVHFYENGVDKTPDSKDEVVKKIESIIGINFDVFKYVMSFTASGESFLEQSAPKQREIIENLFDLDIITEKAAAVSEMKTGIKRDLDIEEFKINAAIENNRKTEEAIKKVQQDLNDWEHNHNKTINDLTVVLNEINGLSDEFFYEEKARHERLAVLTPDIQELRSAINELDRTKKSIEKDMGKLEKEIVHLRDNNCPMCKQSMPDAKKMLVTKEAEFETLGKDLKEVAEGLNNITIHRNQLLEEHNIIQANIHYTSLSDLVQLRSQRDAIVNELNRICAEKNPHMSHLDNLQNTMMQVIDSTILDKLRDDFTHADFLLKLLNNKNSFIRQRIIGKIIPYLNDRLSYYIDRLGLPYKVFFEPDLSVSISHFDQDMDFGNLSTGESQRVNLGLSFAFRDVLSNMHTSFNLLLIDEVLDSGLDEIGVYNTVDLLNDMVKDQNMSIFLISHRQEVGTMVDNTMKVIKEGGFSRIEEHVE